MRNAKECASTSIAAIIIGALVTATLVVTGTTASATPEQHHLALPPAVHLAATITPDGASLHTIAPTAPAQVDVVVGDTLSGLSAEHLGDPGRWTDLWNANRAVVGGNPNLIYPGQALTLPTGHVDAPADVALVAPTPRTPPVPAKPTHHHVAAPSTTPPPSARVNLGNYGGFEACVIRRESSGNPQVMNASGHYGLFQFDFRTWVSGGGSPSTFGHASVAEQEAVFARVYAARGTEPWSPSDHC